MLCIEWLSECFTHLKFGIGSQKSVWNIFFIVVSVHLFQQAFPGLCDILNNCHPPSVTGQLLIFVTLWTTKMKLTHLDERIHVLDAETDVWKVVRDIAESGVSNADAFVLIGL